jgi:mycothiol synthase
VKNGITIRTFRPGIDDEAWLAVNSAAFAHHPDQGSWTLDDLKARMAEPWFDPDGFFVATTAGDDGSEQMVGFHWTKVHGGLVTHAHDGSGLHSHEGHGHDPIGEVYVIGVLPSVAGQGLGRALALIGLQHLRTLGLPDAMLYVEGDNLAARRLYESLGFRHWDTDVMFSSPVAARP